MIVTRRRKMSSNRIHFYVYTSEDNWSGENYYEVWAHTADDDSVIYHSTNIKSEQFNDMMDLVVSLGYRPVVMESIVPYEEWNGDEDNE